MKFPFDISDIIPKKITIISAENIPKNPRRLDKLMIVVNELGYASAAAQKLHGPITTLVKLRNNPKQRLYIMRVANELISTDQIEITSREDLHMFNSSGFAGYRDMVDDKKYSIVGMIKVGVKTLYVTDELNRQAEINPLCILDFYIDHNLQRQGYGKNLFEYMLQMEVVTPHHLAYDRPSSKFLAFLKKYYNLEDYLPQTNNFVVFKEYGLRHIDLDSRGRPKTSLPPLPKSLQPLYDNHVGKEVNLADKVISQPKTVNTRNNEGLARRFTNVLTRPAAIQSQFQSFSFLPNVDSIIPPISTNPSGESENENKTIMASTTPQTTKPSTPEWNHSQEIHRQQSPPDDSSIFDSNDPLDSYLPSLKKKTSTSAFFSSEHVIEPISNRAKLDWTQHNSTLAGLSSTVFKPSFNPVEADRQNKVLMILNEGQIQRALPAIPLNYEPIKDIRASVAAGVRSYAEPRKRNYNQRYKQIHSSNIRF